MSPAERNYEVHDKEMLAVVYACLQWVTTQTSTDTGTGLFCQLRPKLAGLVVISSASAEPNHPRPNSLLPARVSFASTEAEDTVLHASSQENSAVHVARHGSRQWARTRGVIVQQVRHLRAPHPEGQGESLASASPIGAEQVSLTRARFRGGEPTARLQRPSQNHNPTLLFMLPDHSFALPRLAFDRHPETMSYEDFRQDKVVARGSGQVDRILARLKGGNKQLRVVHQVEIECGVDGVNLVAELMRLVKETVTTFRLQITPSNPPPSACPPSTRSQPADGIQRAFYIKPSASWPLDRLTDTLVLCTKLERVELGSARNMRLTTIIIMQRSATLLRKQKRV